MKKERYLEHLIAAKQFHFRHLDIAGIDNEPAVKIFSRSVLEQEICLFANNVASGNDYCLLLHKKIMHAMRQRKPLPVVRFADGEYAFYRCTLDCNGLYRQAESVHAIRDAMPQHLSALRYVAANGFLAPLVFPNNSHAAAEEIFSFLKKKPDSSGAGFLDFLRAGGIALTPANYVPFYTVYAYLTSPHFLGAMDGKNICILNSESNEESCRDWFAQSGSRPVLTFVDIPAEYVATRWEKSKLDILNKIPQATDLCLTGAGVGALLICADVAEKFSIPSIDAGHVLNMMNGRVDKSNGARLYTIRKK